MLSPSENVQLIHHVRNRREQTTNIVLSLSIIAICSYVFADATEIWMSIILCVILAVALIFFAVSAYLFIVAMRAVLHLKAKSLENDAKIDVIAYHIVTDEAIETIEKHANKAKGA
ncbi:MAG TPA: hypothetical protein VIM37_00575 [Candidatus Microsaccharimonas sp.]|jgi:hypothetical protein